MAKKEEILVKCANCKNCDLLLYEKNGVVIADCLIKGEREVANAVRICELFKQSVNSKEITKLYEMF